MSIRLTLDEAWEAAVEDRTVVMMTPAGTKKIARVRHDPRASFLVESGERYVDLSAVHLTGRVEFVGDAAATARIEAAVDEKYTPNRFSCASCRTAES